jgi:hypothetical protein
MDKADELSGKRPEGLEAARQAVMRSVHAAPLDGENEHHHYRYATEHGLIHALRAAMVEHGLSITPTGVGDVLWVPAAKGGTMYWTQEFALRHTGGEELAVRVRCGGSDSLDKQPYKGMTGALKYALRQCFLIEVGGADPEDNEPVPAGSAPSPADTRNRTDPELRGYSSNGDRAAFLQRIMQHGGLEEDGCNEFMVWMHYTKKCTDWPDNLSKSTQAFRVWFVMFLLGRVHVGNQSGQAWVDLWRKGVKP